MVTHMNFTQPCTWNHMQLFWYFHNWLGISSLQSATTWTHVYKKRIKTFTVFSYGVNYNSILYMIFFVLTFIFKAKAWHVFYLFINVLGAFLYTRCNFEFSCTWLQTKQFLLHGFVCIFWIKYLLYWRCSFSNSFLMHVK